MIAIIRFSARLVINSLKIWNHRNYEVLTGDGLKSFPGVFSHGGNLVLHSLDQGLNRRFFPEQTQDICRSGTVTRRTIIEELDDSRESRFRSYPLNPNYSSRIRDE